MGINRIIIYVLMVARLLHKEVVACEDNNSECGGIFGKLRSLQPRITAMKRS
ncbi:uncharacterized protein G2W53_013993 [Senna tora]|uniref:Uncharacterized protein n=1 Tax=Senna tora TaxID=362788 RepID=A0A834TZY8_9FABA|nr:uncharacterized protein G2W53_013993 [Senna tora]